MTTFNHTHLIEQVKQQQAVVTNLLLVPENVLLMQPNAQAWSIAQVIAHLNVYNRYYHPLLQKFVESTSITGSAYKPGWLGSYFIRLMQPKSAVDVGKKMKAHKNAIPTPQLNALAIIRQHITYQEELIIILEKAVNANLNSRIPIFISPFIQLKAGDLLQFLVAHQQRHHIQISNLLNGYGFEKV
ncbi:MAG: DinB family protein [Chitinophagaceae bacterium]